MTGTTSGYLGHVLSKEKMHASTDVTKNSTADRVHEGQPERTTVVVMRGSRFDH